MALVPSSRSAALPTASLVAIACLASIALGFAVAVIVEPGPLPGEVWIVRRWQQLGEPVPTIAEWVRLTTSTEANLVAAAIPAWIVIKRYGRTGAAAVAVAVLTMLVAQPMLKRLVDRPRPSESAVDVRADYTSLSFPSGHSMSTMAAWGAAVLIAVHAHRPLLATVLCIPIALTSLASLVQGVHWPSDSIAGLALGAISAIATATLLLRDGSGDQEQRPAEPS